MVRWLRLGLLAGVLSLLCGLPRAGAAPLGLPHVGSSAPVAVAQTAPAAGSVTVSGSVSASGTWQSGPSGNTYTDTMTLTGTWQITGQATLGTPRQGVTSQELLLFGIKLRCRPRQVMVATGGSFG